MAMAVWQWRDGNGEMAMARGPEGRFDGAVSVGERAADTSGVPLAELRGCAPCGFQTKPILVPASHPHHRGSFICLASIVYSLEYGGNYRAIACSSCKAFSWVSPAVLLGCHHGAHTRFIGPQPACALGATCGARGIYQFPTVSCHGAIGVSSPFCS